MAPVLALDPWWRQHTQGQTSRRAVLCTYSVFVYDVRGFIIQIWNKAMMFLRCCGVETNLNIWICCCCCCFDRFDRIIFDPPTSASTVVLFLLFRNKNNKDLDNEREYRCCTAPFKVEWNSQGFNFGVKVLRISLYGSISVHQRKCSCRTVWENGKDRVIKRDCHVALPNMRSVNSKKELVAANKIQCSAI